MPVSGPLAGGSKSAIAPCGAIKYPRMRCASVTCSEGPITLAAALPAYLQNLSLCLLQPAVHVCNCPKRLTCCVAARTGHGKGSERCELRITTIGLCTPVQFDGPIACSGEAGVAEETMNVICLDLERRRARVIELSIDVPLRERVPWLSRCVDTEGQVGLLTGG